MQDRGLYERILGLPDPWHVTEVELRDEAREVVVDVARRGLPVLACPECGASMTAYDHRTRRATGSNAKANTTIRIMVAGPTINHWHLFESPTAPNPKCETSTT